MEKWATHAPVCSPSAIVWDMNPSPAFLRPVDEPGGCCEWMSSERCSESWSQNKWLVDYSVSDFWVTRRTPNLLAFKLPTNDNNVEILQVTPLVVLVVVQQHIWTFICDCWSTCRCDFGFKTEAFDLVFFFLHFQILKQLEQSHIKSACAGAELPERRKIT